MDQPEAKEIEAAIRRMTASPTAIATAFRPNPAIQAAAAGLANADWMTKLAPTFGFGRAFRGIEAARAVEGLAAHQNALVARSLDAVRSPVLFSIAENAQRTVLVFAGLGGAVEDALKPLRAYQGVFKQLSESLARFTEQQQEIDDHLDAFVLRHGWPIPLDLPMSAYARVVKMGDRPKREVTAAMNYWFRPESHAFRSCANTLLKRPLLESRRPLLRQALRAHRREDHYLVINSLLPLVEGVLVDAVFRDAVPPPKGRVQQAVGKLKTDDPDDAVLRAIESLVVAGAAGMGLFTRSDPSIYGRPGEPRSLNRHAILHGYARRYATRANALRMILLMTVLVEVIDLYERRGSESQ